MKIYTIGSYVITVQHKDEMDRMKPAIAAEPIRAGQLVVLDKPKAGTKKEQHIIDMAEKEGWRLLWVRDTEKRMRFKRGVDDILDVWHEKGTVGTIISHPTKGRKQLFRKNVNEAMLRKILNNPRVHTDEGYYTT